MNKLKKFLRWSTIALLLTVLLGYCYCSRPIIWQTWVKFYSDGSTMHGTTYMWDEGGHGQEYYGKPDEADGLVVANSEDQCSMTYKSGARKLYVVDFKDTGQHSVTYSQPRSTHSPDEMVDLMDFYADGTFKWKHYYEGGEERWTEGSISSYVYDNKTKWISIYEIKEPKRVSIYGSKEPDKIIKKRHLSEFPHRALYFEPVADMPYDEQGRKQEASWRNDMRAKLNLTHPEQESCDFVKMSKWLGIFEYRTPPR